jgi:hypothetical protein
MVKSSPTDLVRSASPAMSIDVPDESKMNKG